MGWKSWVICLSPLGSFLSGCPRVGSLKDSNYTKWINFRKSRFLIHHKGEEHTLLLPKDSNHKFYVPKKCTTIQMPHMATKNQARDKATLHDTSICDVSKEFPRIIVMCMFKRFSLVYHIWEHIKQYLPKGHGSLLKNLAHAWCSFASHQVVAHKRYWLCHRNVIRITKGT